MCDALRDLIPFAQFKKTEKRLWRSVTFSKVGGFLKLNENGYILYRKNEFVTIWATLLGLLLIADILQVPKNL